MSQNRDNIEPLIQEIRTLSVAEKAKTGALALLNIIPYAGGVVASVVGEYANYRKAEKVCDVLSDLNSKRDERKIEALKNGLGYAFLADDSFERKQLLLQTLRSCTSMEILVLAALYDASDPYIVRKGGPPPSRPFPKSYTPGLGAVPYSDFSTSEGFASSYLDTITSQGDWKPIGNSNSCGQPTLLKFLADQVHFEERDVDGALRLLDGKGLASAGANLNRSDCKVLKWTPSSPNGIYRTITASDAVLYATGEVRATPLEASRTDFGRGFLSFCRHS